MSYEATYSSALNIVEMLRILENRWTGSMPIAELAERVDVSEKTIKRYVDAVGSRFFNDNGTPLVVRGMVNERVCAVMPRKSTRLSGNIFQYAAVYAAARTFDALREPVLGFGAELVLERMKGDLREHKSLEMMERVRTGFHYLAFGPKDYEGGEDILDAIVQAVLGSYGVDISYRSRRGSRERFVEPYTLVMYRDGFYLLARDPEDEVGLKRFAVERIEGIKSHKESRFTVPLDYSPEDHFQEGLGIWFANDPPVDVQIAFDELAIASVRERRWPGFKGFSEGRDGREILHLTIPLTPELVTWVLTWGPLAEVLSPDELREQVTVSLRETLDIYTTP